MKLVDLLRNTLCLFNKFVGSVGVQLWTNRVSEVLHSNTFDFRLKWIPSRVTVNINGMFSIDKTLSYLRKLKVSLNK